MIQAKTLDKYFSVGSSSPFTHSSFWPHPFLLYFLIIFLVVFFLVVFFSFFFFFSFVSFFNILVGTF